MVIVHIIDKFSSDRLFLYLVLDIYSFNPIKPGLFGASQTWGGRSGRKKCYTYGGNMKLTSIIRYYERNTNHSLFSYDIIIFADVSIFADDVIKKPSKYDKNLGYDI